MDKGTDRPQDDFIPVLGVWEREAPVPPRPEPGQGKEGFLCVSTFVPGAPLVHLVDAKWPLKMTVRH